MVEVSVGGWRRGKKNGRGRGGERGGKVVKVQQWNSDLLQQPLSLLL